LAKIGVLLTNIGTPKSPEAQDVGSYLDEFLMDPYVVDIPFLLRWILVKLLIVPRRKYKSGQAYKKIWLKEGSPLLVNSQQLVLDLGKSLGQNFSVKLGMRYAEPSIGRAITAFVSEGVSKLVVIPMYPQFASSSSTSSLEKIREEVNLQNWTTEIKNIDAFFDRPEFIDSYAMIIRESLADRKVDHYLFSYHGLPERQIQALHPNHCFQTANCCEVMSAKNQNCYRAQCVQTTLRLAKALNLESGQFSFSFQSRLGRTKWIDPYTDHILPELARNGVKTLAVVCPSFVADCLETLEEIGLRGQTDFKAAGGHELYLVPCLNAHPIWTKSLSQLILKSL